MTDDQPPATEHSDPGEVTPADLDAIPAVYRRIIAKWLTQRACLRSGGIITEAWAITHNQALLESAVDLLNPFEQEESTVSQANAALADLALDGPSTNHDGTPTGVMFLGSASYVAMRYYSAALNEIYQLRAALAHEAKKLRDDLRLNTYPVGARARIMKAIERMRAAARGDSTRTYRAAKVDNKAALESAGANECFTHHDWKTQVDQDSVTAT